MSKYVNIDYGNDMEYEEWYFSKGQLWFKGIWINGSGYGYFEEYNEDGSFNEYETGYFLGGNKVSDTNEVGYCLIWRKVIV